jgi:hypothetical protein
MMDKVGDYLKARKKGAAVMAHLRQTDADATLTFEDFVQGCVKISLTPAQCQDMGAVFERSCMFTTVEGGKIVHHTELVAPQSAWLSLLGAV